MGVQVDQADRAHREDTELFKNSPSLINWSGILNDTTYCLPSCLTISNSRSSPAVTMSLSPNPNQKVECHYILKLTNDKKVDSSRDRGKPFSFTVGKGEVIKGWDEGLTLMSVGQRAKLTVPPSKGYGSSGIPGVIPPNSTLIFDIELLKVK